MRRIGLLLCVVASMFAAEPADLDFQAETLQITVRLPMADGKVYADHRLTLAADQPRDRVVLQLLDPRFRTVLADTGERLGLLLRPAARAQQVVYDRQVKRDRRIRLQLDLTPPARDVRSLLDLDGTVQLTVGIGEPRILPCPLLPQPQEAILVPGFAAGSVRVSEVAENRVVLVLSTALAERVEDVSFADAAGALLVAKPPQRRTVDGAQRLQFTFEDGASVAVANIAWFPELRTDTIRIHIPRLEIPGGLPGIGAATAPPPTVPVSKQAKVSQPLHLAIAAKDGSAVQGILASNPDALEKAEGDGRRPLHRAVVLGASDLVLRLLDAGADPSARTREGAYTALDLAAYAGDAACVSVLLDKHADVAAVLPGNGWTALHQAVHASSAATVLVLLAHGADPWQQAKDGRSAVDLARDEGRWTILRLLLGNPPQ